MKEALAIYYPFPSKVFAVLYLLVHGPRRIVSAARVVERIDA